uniref:Histone acetyltransferase n=1 Tax=Panagrolaimus sp. ES5 TaxID=591445 RepID=A0AC34F0F3_9BILA
MSSQDQESKGVIPINAKLADDCSNQLLLVFHSYTCYLNKKFNSEYVCNNTPLCAHMKNVVQHVLTCHKKEDCSFQHCSDAKLSLVHFLNCKSSDCVICEPTRVNFVKQNGSPDIDHAATSIAFYLEDIEDAFSHV